jgi:hypothetical protein
VRLEGWNSVPVGYGAQFDVSEAPLWLRLWSRTPFLDRFAHPLLVRRGFGWLTPHAGGAGRGPVGDGWRLRPEGYRAPGSETPLR